MPEIKIGDEVEVVFADTRDSVVIRIAKVLGMESDKYTLELWFKGCAMLFPMPKDQVYRPFSLQRFIKIGDQYMKVVNE